MPDIELIRDLMIEASCASIGEGYDWDDDAAVVEAFLSNVTLEQTVAFAREMFKRHGYALEAPDARR